MTEPSRRHLTSSLKLGTKMLESAIVLSTEVALGGTSRMAEPMGMTFFFYLLIVLLRCNSHPIQFMHLKSLFNLVGFSIFTRLCKHPHNQRHSTLPPQNPVPLSRSLPLFPQTPIFPASGSLWKPLIYFLSILDILYKMNHIIWGPS